MFSGVERGSGELFLSLVDKRDTARLYPIIKQLIAPGTTIMPDGWKSYALLKDDPDYQHFTVMHKYNFGDPETGAHTRKIERVWNAVKQAYSEVREVQGLFPWIPCRIHLEKPESKQRKPVTFIFQTCSRFLPTSTSW